MFTVYLKVYLIVSMDTAITQLIFQLQLFSINFPRKATFLFHRLIIENITQTAAIESLFLSETLQASLIAEFLSVFLSSRLSQKIPLRYKNSMAFLATKFQTHIQSSHKTSWLDSSKKYSWYISYQFIF